MKNNQFAEISNLISNGEIDKAQIKLSKLHAQYQNNSEYLFLRSKIFYLNKLYYLAIDTLFIALEFDQSDKIYSLLGEIYMILGNEDLSKKILNKSSRSAVINDMKDTMTGSYRKTN